MEFRADSLIEALGAVGEVLRDQGKPVTIVVIGGSALVLQGLAPTTRTTKDVDVMGLIVEGRLVPAEEMPPELVKAAQDVGTLLELTPDWINNGPAQQIADGLPPGFEKDLVVRTYGGLTVMVPSRFSQICLKVYAASDPSLPNKHEQDLRDIPDLDPDELMRAADWASDVRARRNPRDRVAQVVAKVLNDE